VDWGDGSAKSTFSASPGALSAAHAYVNDRSTPYTVSVTVKDSTGASAAASFAVSVANVAPAVTITAPAPGGVVGTRSTLSFKASFSDPGTADTHTCTIDWGDGSTSSGTIVESGGSGTCSASTSYKFVGTYTIKVTVKDSGGASSSASVSVSVSKGAGPLYILLSAYDTAASRFRASALKTAKAAHLAAAKAKAKAKANAQKAQKAAAQGGAAQGSARRMLTQ